MSNTSVEFSGASMRALMDAMGALTFAIARQLSPEQQDGLATDLSRLAKDARNNGNAELEALMLDMHQKARTGGGAVRPMTIDGVSGRPTGVPDLVPAV